MCIYSADPGEKLNQHSFFLDSLLSIKVQNYHKNLNKTKLAVFLTKMEQKKILITFWLIYL